VLRFLGLCEELFHCGETTHSSCSARNAKFFLHPESARSCDCRTARRSVRITLIAKFCISTPATRLDVIQLQENLDLRLKQRKARDTGICPVRRELYDQAFDELIRQVTLGCRFRGYLLNRIRGELFTTLDSYRSLLQTSVAEDAKAESLETFADPETIVLRGRVADLEAELEIIQRERFFVGCDFKAVADKMDHLERIRTNLYEPEVDFLKRLGDSMERQRFHFEHPPTFEEQELESMINF